MRRASAAALALLVAACAATTPLESYQQAHPGWKPDFPRAGSDAQETLASIYAPHEIERGSITEVRKVRQLAGSGANAGEIAIVARVHCAAPKPLGWFYNEAISWYLLRGGRLAAWRHVAFREFCHAVAQDRPIEPPTEASRETVRAALESITDPSTAASLVDSTTPQPAATVSAAPDPAAEAACPGTSAFAEALREALRREPSVRTYFVSHDLVLTIAVEPDGSFELEKIRPTDFFARQMVQQVRKVSGSPDRPQAPACLLGKTVDLAFPR